MSGTESIRALVSPLRLWWVHTRIKAAKSTSVTIGSRSYSYYASRSKTPECTAPSISSLQAAMALLQKASRGRMEKGSSIWMPTLCGVC